MPLCEHCVSVAEQHRATSVRCFDTHVQMPEKGKVPLPDTDSKTQRLARLYVTVSAASIDLVPCARCETHSFVVQKGFSCFGRYIWLYICSRFHYIFVMRSVATLEDQLYAMEMRGYCPCKELLQST